MTDFTDMKTASQWSPIINLGCADRLNGREMRSGMTDPTCHAAYAYGWKTTDEAENKAGRPMPAKMIQEWEMEQFMVRDPLGFIPLAELQPDIDRVLELAAEGHEVLVRAGE